MAQGGPACVALCRRRPCPSSRETALPPGPYALVFLLEVMEHVGELPALYESKMAFLRQALAFAGPGGRVILSVPKMVGPAFLAQRAGQWLFRQQRERLTWGELLRSGAVGGHHGARAPVARGPCGLQPPHVRGRLAPRVPPRSPPFVAVPGRLPGRSGRGRLRQTDRVKPPHWASRSVTVSQGALPRLAPAAIVGYGIAGGGGDAMDRVAPCNFLGFPQLYRPHMVFRTRPRVSPTSGLIMVSQLGQ